MILTLFLYILSAVANQESSNYNNRLYERNNRKVARRNCNACGLRDPYAKVYRNVLLNSSKKVKIAPTPYKPENLLNAKRNNNNDRYIINNGPVRNTLLKNDAFGYFLGDGASSASTISKPIENKQLKESIRKMLNYLGDVILIGLMKHYAAEISELQRLLQGANIDERCYESIKEFYKKNASIRFSSYSALFLSALNKKTETLDDNGEDFAVQSLDQLVDFNDIKKISKDSEVALWHDFEMGIHEGKLFDDTVQLFEIYNSLLENETSYIKLAAHNLNLAFGSGINFLSSIDIFLKTSEHYI